MRIRRRPQAQQQQALPPPYPYLLPPEQQPSDPFVTAPHPQPPPPPNAWPPLPSRGEDDAEPRWGKRIKPTEELPLHPHPDRPDADPGPAALPSRPPQGGGSIDDDPPVHGHGHGHGGDARRRQGADGHESSLQAGKVSMINAEERAAVNGVIPAVVAAVNVKGGTKNEQGSGGSKKRRRGPPVLMEGSRCSRVNGRGWRCSQPTLVGYSLCEHHLGKGRHQNQSANGRAEHSGWKNGATTLGRTEPSIKKKVAQPSVPAAPTANGRAEPASSRKSTDALSVVAATAHAASRTSSGGDRLINRPVDRGAVEIKIL